MGRIPQPLRKVLKVSRIKNVPKSQIILYKGDMPHDVYVIKYGAVKIYDIDDNGNEKILHIIKTPALLPFVFFSGVNRPTNWFYGALTDCDLFTIPNDKLHRAMLGDSTLALLLINSFSEDMHELLVRLSSLGKTQVRDKLYAALHFLLAHHSTKKRGGWWRVDFAVNQQLLADLSGVTRESTAMAMKELHDHKVIRCPKVSQLEINKVKLQTLSLT